MSDAGTVQRPDPPRARRPRRTAGVRAPGRWRRWVVELAIVLSVLAGFRWWQQRGLPNAQAPALEGHGPHGEALRLPSAPGEPVLVYFWATWCGVCDAMASNVHAVAEDHRVLTVASRSGDGARVLSAQPRAQALPTLLDPDGSLARRYGVAAYPTSLVIDAEGQVRFAEVGYTTELGLRARLWLAAR